MTHPLEEPGRTSLFVDPCCLVIFGATGDLTSRKLMPAIYNLAREGQLPPQFACIGFARREKSHEIFRKEMHDDVSKFARIQPLDEAAWKRFEGQLYYHISEFHDDDGYKRLGEFLKELDAKAGTKGNRIFYLATPSSYFPLICEKLHKNGLIYDFQTEKERWSRVVIEKPFGNDLPSALALQAELKNYMSERQIYRIDHYLGKETVQNLLVFRFANALFESVWNSRYIDHVQITVAEEIGIGTRGALWEESGLVRDIIQNHMMQLISLVAMEPPSNLNADAIHDEKVKVLQAIRPIKEKFSEFAVRGQYGPGFVHGEKAVGYRQEGKVAPDSSVETYAALRLFIDNWRWAGTPFYLRAGKRLPKRATEIAITFKEPPNVLFQATPGGGGEPNVLVIRIQPNEGSSLKVNCKVPGPSSPIQPVKMDFRYGSYFGTIPFEAYERLIYDAILGDSTLFAREDEVFASWKLLTPILDVWKQEKATEFPNYESGTWGPAAADQLIARDGRTWRIL